MTFSCQRTFSRSRQHLISKARNRRLSLFFSVHSTCRLPTTASQKQMTSAVVISLQCYHSCNSTAVDIKAVFVNSHRKYSQHQSKCCQLAQIWILVRELGLKYLVCKDSEQVVKVILQKGASPPHIDGSTVFARWHQCASPSNTCFLGPTRVHNPNSISIDLAIFAGLTIVTDRQTDRPRYSVCNNRLRICT